MDSIRRTVITLCTLLSCLTIGAQMESQLTYRRYTAQDGLPQMQTERLWQDSRGYIYIGTLSGFVRFDGRSFTPFLKGRRLNIVGFTEVGDGKSSSEVRALGFFRQWRVDYDDVEPMPLDPQGHWLLNNLNAGSLPDGYVLVEDSLEEHRRLCRMTKDGLTTVLTHSLLDEMTPDRKLCLNTSSGEVIIPLETGVFRIAKGKREPVRLSARGDVYTLLPTDSTLLAFASDGIYSVGRDSLSLLTAADWSAASYGLTVRRLHGGGLIVADEHSVYLCDHQQVRQLFTGINLIRDVLVDRWDRLWVASYQGVYCFFNRCFSNHQLADQNDIVRAVAADKDNGLVMGTLNGKVLRTQHSTFNTQHSKFIIGEADNSTFNTQHSTFLSDDPQQFYAPSAVRIGDHVFMAGNGDVVSVSGDSLHWLSLPRDRYQFVGQAWGQLIIGTRNTILAYNTATGILDTLTTAILHPWCTACDSDGRLWVGSSSGLYSISRDHQVSKTEYNTQKLIISAMTSDPQGHIFFASADSVFTVRQGQAETLNTQMPMLTGHEVRSLHVSPRGYLVVAVVDGLFVGRIDQAAQVSDVRFFNHLNGFTMTEPLKATMTETGDGTVWLPGVEQMTSFRPADLLALNEEDTYIAPPLRWWQHWWVWLTALLLLSLSIWGGTRWYEKRRHRRRLIRLQRDKLLREEQIEAIRRKAIEEQKANTLAKDIVKMTENDFEQRLTLRTASGTTMADVKDIVYFKGDGNYSLMVTFHDKDTVLLGLGALEKMLSPDMFVRADRSTLVNIHHIVKLLPKQRRCIFRSPTGTELETTLLAPAFKRLQSLLEER